MWSPRRAPRGPHPGLCRLGLHRQLRGAALGLGATEVDLVKLGGVRQHRDDIVPYLEEATEDRHVVVAACEPVDELTGTKTGEKRGVAGQMPSVPSARER